ncbi:hypothetical protein SDC9_187071 [bioreactor metagenome]|uniref:Uncharacterized protein n=1 Tax=bioreactor metagenome TaxID=1076179 RepID=A0A645HW19_9ZZZZ
MNRVCIGNFRCRDDIWDFQIGIFAGSGSDAYRLIRKTHMKAVFVGCGINRYRFDSHFLAGAQNPHCNFAAVGY